MLKRRKGSLFIISAPSGAGKTTLCKKIVTTVDSLVPSVSFTTRKPRGGEVNDLDYTFIGEEEFREMIAGGDFVEWAEVHGNLYGTSRDRLEGLMDSGLDVILDIDTQGARQIRKLYGDGVFIFILPPSIEILRRRLEKRRSNSREDMARRLGAAIDEIKEYNNYDYVIINDVLKDSVRLLEAIITAERHKTERTDKSIIEKILA